MTKAKVFFTSDQHFFHSSIIKYTNRPFSSLEEMHDALISNWNSVVSTIDLVYIIGDFSVLRPTTDNNSLIIKLLNKLNGHKYMIPGNHDQDFWKKWNARNNGHTIAKTTILPHVVSSYKNELLDNTICMCHWRMDGWHKKNYGSYHLYGHSHTKVPIYSDSPHRVNVGVDAWNYYPVSIEQILEAIKTVKQNTALQQPEVNQKISFDFF